MSHYLTQSFNFADQIYTLIINLFASSNRINIDKIKNKK